MLDFDRVSYVLSDEAVNYEDYIESINCIMMALSIDERDLLRWLKLDGYSIKEVALFTKKSESATKVSMHRLLKKSKTIFSKL